MIKAVTTARASGARAVSMVRTEWDIAGRCQAPIVVEHWSRSPPRHRRYLDKAAQITAKRIMELWPGSEVTAIRSTKIGQGKTVTVEPGKAFPLGLTLHVRCRKCPACLLQRELLWRSRATTEIRYGVRNWFVTLTLSPTEQALARARAQQRATRQGSVFETFKASEQFAAIVREINPLITRWLKRVRKESDTAFRYLLVTEAHKSGLPHFHLLVHERNPQKPISKRTLQAQWKHGFSSAKLVADDASARYVCKYIGKSALARVRASGHYGNGLIHSVSVDQVLPGRPSGVFSTRSATRGADPASAETTRNGDIDNHE